MTVQNENVVRVAAAEINENGKYMTLAQASEVMNLKSANIRTLVRQEKLNGQTVFITDFGVHATRVETADVERYMLENPAKQTTGKRGRIAGTGKKFYKVRINQADFDAVNAVLKQFDAELLPVLKPKAQNPESE